MKKSFWIIVSGILFVLTIVLGRCVYERSQISKLIQPKYDAVCNACENYLPGIISWGDSLTQGACGKGVSYSSELQHLIKTEILEQFDSTQLADAFGAQDNYDFSEYQIPEVPVLNMGVGGEDTHTICGRSGAIPFRVKNDFVIPAGRQKVEMDFVVGSPLRQGDAGIRWVEIGGVRGTIEVEQESYWDSEHTYYFKRDKRGATVSIPAGTQIITEGNFIGKEYIPIIYIGENGGYSSMEELISQQMAIINHQNMSSCNEGKFIVIGSHTGTAEERKEYEQALSEYYGMQYINLREYMSTQGVQDANELYDAGIVTTAEDEAAMSLGMTPECLEADGIHFNKYGYMLIGRLIYNRMEELGYFDQIKETISNEMRVE